jgi:hypothetical protein
MPAAGTSVASPAPITAPPSEGVPVSIEVRRLPDLATPRPPRVGRSIGEILGSPPPPEAISTLLPAHTERAVLWTLAGTPLCRGDLDEGAAVAALSRGRVLSGLPRRPVHTTSRGLQLMLDGGPGMDPYRTDVRQLAARLADLMPADLLREYWYVDDPSGPHGVTGAGELVGRRYALPPTGTPILVVTAFGRRGPSVPFAKSVLASWRRLVASARRAGNPLTFLSPTPDDIAPGRLGPAPVLGWSPATSVRTVLRAVRTAAPLRLGAGEDAP